MDIEICVFSIESCQNAQRAGAQRVELCAGLYEGGTTPSYGMIERARAILGIQLYVMVRPRGGDFCYDNDEFELMKTDIEIAKKLGADGVVIGLLLPNGQIDVMRTTELVQLAQPMGVTFHRAFDRALEPFEALEAVIATGAERILTSGQQPFAPQGRELLAQLVEKAAGRIEIMAGAGVNAKNALSLAETGVAALHLTAKTMRSGSMDYRKPAFEPIHQVTTHEYDITYSSQTSIEDVIEALKTSF